MPVEQTWRAVLISNIQIVKFPAYYHTLTAKNSLAPKQKHSSSETRKIPLPSFAISSDKSKCFGGFEDHRNEPYI